MSFECVELGTLVSHRKGFAFKSRDYQAIGNPVVRVSNFTSDSISTDDLKFVSDDIAINTKSVELKSLDIIIATVGSWPSNPASIVGKTIMVPEALNGALLNQNSVRLRVLTKSLVDQEYLFYALKNQSFSDYLVSTAQGSANQASITLKDILKYQVPWPLESERNKIVSIIGSIRRKIELNTQINQTLEQIAGALFKSWFVDFDPVKAKIKIKAREEWLANHSPLEGESKSANAVPRDSVGGKLLHSGGRIKRLYTPQALAYAKTLRKNQTDAEGLLWYYLRNKQMAGFKFRRQQAIGRYIVDFVCLPEKLIIELDGSQHASQQEYDQQRDTFLRTQGFTVLRFWNNEIVEHCLEVLEKVYQQLIPPPNQTAPVGLSSSTPPQGGSDLQEAMNLAAMSVIAAKSSEQLAELKQSKPDAYEQLAQTAALFPSAMQESELGDIPDGWEITTLKSLSDKISKGTTPSKQDLATEEDEASIKFVKVKDIDDQGEIIRNSLELIPNSIHIGKLKRSVLETNDILFSIAGTIGRVATVDNDLNNANTNQAVAFIRLKDKEKFLPLVYMALRESRLQKKALASIVQGVQANLSLANVGEMEMIIPSGGVLELWNKQCSTIFKKIKSNFAQSRQLASLRDTLLPKLLSGEISLAKAHATEEVIA